MKLISRRAWGARAPRGRTVRNLTGPTRGHWNGNTIKIQGSLEWDHAKCAAIVRGIQNYHMDANGWDDIAYNFVECPHGYTFEGRGLNVRSAANGTSAANNSGHALMCLAGEDNRFPVEEKVGFRHAVRYIFDQTNAPDAAIGHRDDKQTACPGNERYNWIRQGMPIPSTPPAGNPTLRLGDRGDAVTTVQRIIHDKAGGNLVVSGYFDAHTEVRVKDLQRTFGLTIDGIVGDATWKALAYLTTRPDSQLNPYGDWPHIGKPLVQHGSTHASVRYLQDVINRQAGGNISVHGTFDVQTTQRVKDFQKYFGLSADGIVGSATWSMVDYIAKRLN